MPAVLRSLLGTGGRHFLAVTRSAILSYSAFGMMCRVTTSPGFVIGTPRNHPVCFCGSHARKTQQLVFSGSIQVEWLVAAPALAYTRRHSLGITLHLRRCFRGLLLQVLRVFLLRAAREDSQQQNCGKAPISEEVHFDQLLSAVLADYLSPARLAIIVGTGAVRRRFSRKIERRDPDEDALPAQRTVRFFRHRTGQACIVVSPLSCGCTKLVSSSNCLENLGGPIGAFVPAEPTSYLFGTANELSASGQNWTAWKS